MRAKITKRAVDALRPGESISDIEVRGFRVRRLTGGLISYELRYGPAAARRFVKLGDHGSVTPDQARDFAKKHTGEVAAGKDPAIARRATRAAAEKTLDAVLDNFLARYVRQQGLRTADEIERTFRMYVRVPLGGQSIYDLRRRDIVTLLDRIEDHNGSVMADRALAYLRKALNWQAARDDLFSSPIVRGMARTKPKERARSRVLDDQEIRDVWRALDALRPGIDAPACYPAFVRTLLLTAQRREEVSRMCWDEIEGDTWVIPAARYKTKREIVVPITLEVMRMLGPRRDGFVFSSDGGKHAFSGFSKAKAAIDVKLLELRKAERRPPMPPWVHHDLRRSARSLMSRAGVTADIAERVLGHVIGGVRGVYDRHEYQAEKRDALEKLAALVDRILHPGEPVVAFPRWRRP
jgi:integrase